MKTKITITLMLLISLVGASDYDFVNFDKNDKISIKISGNSFFKNNEYFSKFRKGYTGIGFYINPEIIYQKSDKVLYKAGMYYLKYSGQDTCTRKIPTFSIEYQINQHHTFISGKIKREYLHLLPEQIMETDALYQNGPEFGFQLLSDYKKFQSDLWLNWIHYLFEGKDDKEAFIAGYQARAILYDKSGLEISIPAALTAYHNGGQIDNSDLPTLNMLNAYTGLTILKELDESWSISTEINYFIYRGSKDTIPGWPIYADGNALKLKMNLIHKDGWSITGGMWQGNRYIAPFGEYLFQSRSWYLSDYSKQKRNIVFFKLEKLIKENSPYFQPFIYLYYDLDAKHMDYSYGFYLIFNELFPHK